MKRIINNIYMIKFWVLLVFFGLLFSGCEKNMLDKFPEDALSVSTFWQNENEAMLALTGVYQLTRLPNGRPFIHYEAATDNGGEAALTRSFQLTSGELISADERVSWLWTDSYNRIAAANDFLENIGRVPMSENKKAEMIAEVRFIRAYNYFWLNFFWGGVPLITKVLTVDEANTQIRETRAKVNEFIEDELKKAAADLPLTRPADQHGRIVKGAALAMLGRLLMAEERWAEASTVYKEIIDMKVFKIDPRYKVLFEVAGQGSKEIIYSIKNMNDLAASPLHRNFLPQQFGGFHRMDPFHDLVQAYDMIDGLSEDQSLLYDPDNPYVNKDPRLYATIFLPGVSKWRGVTYQSHPDRSARDNMRGVHMGLCVRKWCDENYTGTPVQYGGDHVYIRYAEVLLGYLESEFEANNGVVSQQLLNETVNLIRGRDEVDMPPIQVGDFTRDRMRNERRVELAWEGLRYFDIHRWRITHIVCTGPVKGMKLTNNPQNYTTYPVDENGFYIAKYKNFRNPENYLWPIPQSEIDINPNLEQNDGY